MGLCCSKSGSIEIQDGADPVVASPTDVKTIQTLSASVPFPLPVQPSHVHKEELIPSEEQPLISFPVPPKPATAPKLTTRGNVTTTSTSGQQPSSSIPNSNGSSSALATDKAQEASSPPNPVDNVSSTSAVGKPQAIGTTAIVLPSSAVQANNVSSSSPALSSSVQEPTSSPPPIQMNRIGNSSSNIAAVNKPVGSQPPPTSSVPQRPKPIPKPTPRRDIQAVVHDKRQSGLGNPNPVLGLTQPKPPPSIPKFKLFNVADWEHESISTIFKVALIEPKNNTNGTVWLRNLALELEKETIRSLSSNILVRVLTARLQHDPVKISDTYRTDSDDLYALSPFDVKQTSFQYLVECWKRLNSTRDAVAAKGYSSSDTQTALDTLESVRSVLMKEVGDSLRQPTKYPQPFGCITGYPELITLFTSLFNTTDPYHTNSKPPILSSTQLEQFIKEIAQRFEKLNQLDDMFTPLINGLAFHKSLYLPESICGQETGWRGILGGFEILAGIKPVGQLITRMERWIPKGQLPVPVLFEKSSLLGPLCRLGVFPTDWPGIAQGYFSELTRKGGDVVSAVGTLRGTFGLLHKSLASIFEKLARASLESREAVVAYFARIVFLNRRSLSVDRAFAMSESFLFNIQMVLYRLAGPFMDAKFSKIDRIDPLYFINSSRIDIDGEPRILTLSNEVLAKKNKDAPEPNFISNIFYLTIAMSHCGYFRTVRKYSYIRDSIRDFLRRVDFALGDGSWIGTPSERQVRASIEQAITEIDKIRPIQLAFEVCLLDPEVVTRSIAFTSFLITWLIRRVDPRGTHPNPPVELPLPQEVPNSFSMLPEYFIHDAAEYFSFIATIAPEKFGPAPKVDVLTFILTFLTSPWYIKNPDVKANINDILFFGLYGPVGRGIFKPMLNTHRLSLKHLVPAMIRFYIEVEPPRTVPRHTDKFNTRQAIVGILKAAWENPLHRDALNREAKNVDRFVHFVNLIMNDLTLVMDESLGDLARIHNYEAEMGNISRWSADPPDVQARGDAAFLALERQTSIYTAFTILIIDVLKLFTAETKKAFVMPEVVNRFAAMLDHNLQILVGPKSQELRVRNKERYNFNPRGLLGDVIQVYMNLSSEPAFVRAVASDVRSYSRPIFEKAAEIVVKHGIKGTSEVQKFRDLIQRVEKAKEALKAEELVEREVPDEFLDPLTSTLMSDPVKLPSSGVVVDRVTIKAHLLLNSNDPYNRSPLKIEDVIPQPELKAQIEKFMKDRLKERDDADDDDLYAQ